MKRVLLGLAILFLATDSEAGFRHHRQSRLCCCACGEGSGGSSQLTLPQTPLPQAPTSQRPTGQSYNDRMGIKIPDRAFAATTTALTATLSDDGILSITGGNHAVVRQAGSVLAVGTGTGTPTKFDASKVKSIEVNGVRFADLHGVTIPRKVTDGYDADHWAPVGYSYDDINQRAAPDCGHEAALAGWIAAGGRPSITYAGLTATGARYTVRVGDRQSIIEFDGSLQPLDQTVRRPGTFWNILEHRSYRQYWTARGGPGTGTLGAGWAIVDIRGGGEMAQFQVKGLTPSVLPNEFPANRAAIWQAITQGLATRKIVVAETTMPPGPWYGIEMPPYRVCSPFLVKFHQYTVLKAYQGPKGQMLQLRNPWGKDNFTSKVSGSPDDGIIDLPFEECVRSFISIRIG